MNAHTAPLTSMRGSRRVGLGWAASLPALLLPVLSSAAAAHPANPAVSPRKSPVAPQPVRHEFRKRECFLFRSPAESKPFVSDEAECGFATAPASTFKVPHALIALETAVVAGSSVLVPWDRSDQPFDSWERDHSLDSAMKSSVLWFFRRTADAIGRERMKRKLSELGYARDTFDGELTSFWTNGDLVVSPTEQLDFLIRMFSYDLPAARKHIDTVRSTMLMPEGSISNAAGTHPFELHWPDGTRVRGKTGNTSVGGERVSWFVGALESSGRQYVFVSRVRASTRAALPTTAGADLARRHLNALAPKEGPLRAGTSAVFKAKN